MSLFNISWRTQVNNLLFKDVRITNVIDYITSLLEPLKTKGAEWFSFDVDIRKRAKLNSQIIILAAALNDFYGITSAPFVLVETVQGTGSTVYFHNDVEGFNPIFIYNEAEQETVYIYNSSEIVNDHEFVIKIPNSVHTPELERQIINETNTYKLAGKRFITQIY